MRRSYLRETRCLLEVRSGCKFYRPYADSSFLGCGRFFEGTPAEMHKALNETLAALPNDTKVYVAYLLHEAAKRLTDYE